MTEIPSAHSYPRCSDYFTQGKGVCRWSNSSLDMNLVASKTGSPRLTAMTFCSILSIRFSPHLAFFNHLQPTHHSKHIVSRRLRSTDSIASVLDENHLAGSRNSAPEHRR